MCQEWPGKAMGKSRNLSVGEGLSVLCAVMNDAKWVSLAAVVVVLGWAVCAGGAEVLAEHGMVATSHKRAVAIELAASWKPLRKSKIRATKMMKKMR